MQITTNVFAEDRFSMPPGYRGSNPGFVTTSEGVVLIDTPMLPSDAVKWREMIADKGQVHFIISTHNHPDHTAGNCFFPGKVVSHELVKELMTAPLASVAISDKALGLAKKGYSQTDYIRSLLEERDPDGAKSFGRDFYLRLPTITFSDRLTLYVGGHTFSLFYLPGHTVDHIGVYIPEEKVFFAGDNFTYRSQPSLANCLPLEWVASLKRVQAMDIDIVVPGHGKICGKDGLQEFIMFLEECTGMVRGAIKQGMSKEETIRRLSFEELYPAVHPGPDMQRKNVRRLYEMLKNV